MQLNHEADLPDTTSLVPLPEPLTCASVIDERDVEHAITDFMMRRACEQMEAEQQFPFRRSTASQRTRLRRAG